MNTSFAPVIIKQISLLILIAAAVFFIYSIRSYDGVQQLFIEEIPLMVQAEKTADLQVFVQDYNGEAVTTANVVGHYLLHEQEVDVLFHHIDNGLYEGEGLFVIPGQWTGEIEAKTFSTEAKIDMIIDVKQ
ncbi:hypothetical protein ABC345_07070 [Shouchella sp. 1P09AA]|uniref:hypothetical protein n=1 Tax=unclassified Shouchella TaxID=2893065 RepID=UPI0039A0906A